VLRTPYLVSYSFYFISLGSFFKGFSSKLKYIIIKNYLGGFKSNRAGSNEVGLDLAHLADWAGP
jgi:hypothetical protein